MQTFSVTAFEQLMEDLFKIYLAVIVGCLSLQPALKKASSLKQIEGSNKLTFKNLQRILPGIKVCKKQNKTWL